MILNLRRPAALGIVFLLLSPSLAVACEGIWVEPNEEVFKGSEKLASTIRTEGSEEYKILSQTIPSFESETFFKLESECAGKVLKSSSCSFHVKGEPFTEGKAAVLETEYEAVKAKQVASICTALEMGVVAEVCGAGVGIGLKPVGGGANELNFVGRGVGALKEIEIENISPTKITAWLDENRIEEGGGKPQETNFAIKGGSCVPLPSGLNQTEKCTVVVEFVSGVAGKNANYWLRWGNFWRRKKTATFKIKS